MSRLIAVLMVLSAVVWTSWYIYSQRYLPSRNALQELTAQLNAVKVRLEDKKKERFEEEKKRRQQMASAEQTRLRFFDLRRETNQGRISDQRTVRVLTGILRLMHHSRVLLADVKLLTTGTSSVSVPEQPQDGRASPSPSPSPSPAAGASPEPGTSPSPSPAATATPVPTAPPVPAATGSPAVVTAGRIVKQAEIHAIASYGNIAYLVERIKALPPTIKVESYDIKQMGSDDKPEYKNCLELTMKLSISFFTS